MALTGRYDFRRTMTGQLRLWVEYDANGFWDVLTRKKTYCHRWRNANIMDLTAPELRQLMDMRFVHPGHTRHVHAAPRDWPDNGHERAAASIRVLIAPPEGDDR
jgi:hypothetical protein